MSSPVENPEGGGGDPGVGHEPGLDVDGEEDGLLLDVALPEGAGTRGEGHLGGGQPYVEGQLALLREVRQLAGQLLWISS